MKDRLNDLFLRFQIKGFIPIETQELVKDVLDKGKKPKDINPEYS